MTSFKENFPLKYLDPEFSSEMAPNILAMKIVDGKAVDYFFIDAEFIDLALDEINIYEKKYYNSDAYPNVSEWDIIEYGSNIEVTHEVKYVLLPSPREHFEAAFWLGLQKNFNTNQQKMAELTRIRHLAVVEYLEFYESARKAKFMWEFLDVDYLDWFNRGLIGRDYHDRYQDGLTFSVEQAEKHEADSAPMTVGSHHQNEICDTHPFYSIGFTEDEIGYYLDLPLSIVKDYIVGIPPLLGAGIMKAISEAGHDPLGMQLKYIAYVNLL